MSDERPMCQLCGGPIDGEVYRWNDDDRLPMHRRTTRCEGFSVTFGTFGMAGFLIRNAAYLNGKGEPVLLKEKGAAQ